MHEPLMVGNFCKLGDEWVASRPEEDDSGQTLGGWEKDQPVAGSREEKQWL